MKMLVHLVTNEVIYVAYDFDIQVKDVVVYDSIGHVSTHIAIMDETNVGMVDLTGLDAPYDLGVAGKYLYENLVFILNPSFIKELTMSPQGLLETVMEFPKDPSSSANQKATLVMNTWKELHYSGMTSSKLPLDLINGIELLERNDSELSSDELKKKDAAQNLKYKLTARYRIEAEVGDIYDLFADLSKEVLRLKKLVSRDIYARWGGEEMSPVKKSSYFNQLENYVTGIDSNTIVDSEEAEGNDVTFNKRIQRSISIEKILKEEYIDKRSI